MERGRTHGRIALFDVDGTLTRPRKVRRTITSPSKTFGKVFVKKDTGYRNLRNVSRRMRTCLTCSKTSWNDVLTMFLFFACVPDGIFGDAAVLAGSEKGTFVT